MLMEYEKQNHLSAVSMWPSRLILNTYENRKHRQHTSKIYIQLTQNLHKLIS